MENSGLSSTAPHNCIRHKCRARKKALLRSAFNAFTLSVVFVIQYSVKNCIFKGSKTTVSKSVECVE